jgi:hypothetical protein
MRDFMLSLRTQAWRTAGARYSAARRLRRRELFSTVSLALFSALSIAVAFVQRVYAVQQGTAWDNYLTALSVALGVFLLAISLMEWGARNGAQADALHRNAEALTAFQLKVAQRLSELDAGTPVAWPDVEALRIEYEGVKRECQYNHEPLDDLQFRASKRLASEFSGPEATPEISKGRAAWVWLRWFLASVWYFALFWVVIIGSLLVSFWIPR